MSDLRGVDRVRGRVNGVTVYAVSVSALVFQRACELTAAGAMPGDMVWFIAPDRISTNRVELDTSHPEFFTELERKIEDARRQG